MKKQNNFSIKINRNLFYILIAYLVFVALSPIIFAKIQGWISFDNSSGVIGDTIGGITAPFINLLAAFLVYMSFQQQLEANNLLNKENRHNYISNFFNLVRDDIVSNNIKTINSVNIDSWIRMYYDKDLFVRANGNPFSTYEKEKHLFPDHVIKLKINDYVRTPMFDVMSQISAIVKLIEEIKKSDLEDGVRGFYFHKITKMIEDSKFEKLFELFNDPDIKEFDILDPANLRNYAFISSNLQKLNDWDYLYFNRPQL